MATTPDDRRKKRPRLSGSDSSTKDAKMPEEAPASMKQDRSLRSRSKDSSQDVVQGMWGDAMEMPLSLQQQALTENNGEKGLPSKLGQQSEPHGSSGPRKKTKDSPDVEDLRHFVETLGGALEDGWQIDAHRIYGGKLTKTYISPSKEKFRSRIEVAKHLGLDVSSPKKGETPKANNEAILMDQGEESNVAEEIGDHVTLQYRKGMKSTLRNHTHAKDSGQRKEQGSKSPSLDGKATPNTNTGLVLASDASKVLVNVHKMPETSIVTQRCQDALRSIISTSNFAALSHALQGGASLGALESPLQLKARPFLAGSLDLQLIHLRLSTGVYGQTPELFSTDIQEVWQKITAAGNELVALSRTLSELSDNLYKQQILSLFQEGASEQISERKELLPSPSQHGKQSIEDGDITQDNSLLLLENRSVIPPESFNARQANLPGESVPGEEKLMSEDADGNPQSLLKRSGVVPRSHQKKRRPKKVNKSKRHIVPKSKAVEINMPGVCKSCGLLQGKDFVVCRLCKVVFHAHCLETPPKGVPDNAWCCPSCATKENATRKREVLKATGRTEVCKVCKQGDDGVLLCDACEAAFHMNCVDPPVGRVPDECWYCPSCAEDQKKSVGSFEDAIKNHTHPDGHNCAVCDRISKGSLTPNENASTEHAALEKSSSLEGPGFQDHSSPHGAPKNAVQIRSREPSVENSLPEPAFLLEYDNACKVCGADSTKSAVSCTWCLKRFHLSCLRPPLKRLPRKTWFCPSCLCRVCKIDANDDAIVLCDGCDDGYHTYCLNPPLSERPEGVWFCPSCAKDLAPNSPKQTEVFKRKRKSTEPRRST